MASSDLPARRVDPAQLSAILRRATEMAGDVTALTTDDLADVAAEAGLPAESVAAALAESRAGVDRRRRLLDRLLGPARVDANTPVDADEAAAVETVRRWLEVDHGLQASIDRNGVVVATRRTGITGAVSSSMRRVQGAGGLDKARTVRAAAVAIDDAGAACVVADITNKRNEAIAGGGAVAGGSMMVVGVAAAVASPVVLVALPVAALAGLGTARLAHRRTVTTMSRQVELTVAAIGRNEDPTHPVERLLRPGRPRRRSRDRRPS